MARHLEKAPAAGTIIMTVTMGGTFQAEMMVIIMTMVMMKAVTSMKKRAPSTKVVEVWLT